MGNLFVVAVIAWMIGLAMGGSAIERKIAKDEKYLGQTRIDKKAYKIELVKEGE